MTSSPAVDRHQHEGSAGGARLLSAVGAWSAVHLVLALTWLLDPTRWPWITPGPGVAALRPAGGATTILLLAGAGLALTLVAARASSRRTTHGATLGAAALAVVLAALAADLGVLALLGYVFAITAPVVAVGALAAGALRERSARPWLLGVLGLVAVAVAAGPLSAGTLGRLGSGLAEALAERASPPAHRALLLLGSALWAATAVALRRRATGRCTVCGRPGPDWTRPAEALRWGRIFTFAAAACVLPYVLLRATWLTPWPLWAPGEMTPEMRVFGLALGLAAVGGAVLTVGLVRPWGEVWPRWLPVVRGRPVPWRVPVVAGGVVATALLAASPALLEVGVRGVLDGDPGRAAMLVVLPTLPWGLALAAAVLAYAYRRRGTCRVCGRGEAPLPVRP